MKIASPDQIDASEFPLLQKPDRNLLLFLLSFLAIGAYPHIVNLNPVFTSLFYVFIGYKAVVAFYPNMQPHRLILVLLTLAGFGIVILFSTPLVSSETGICLLLVMAGLKALEITRRRDIQFTVLLGFFIEITIFIYTDSIAITLLMLFVAIGLIAILIRINCLTPTKYPFQLRQAMKLSLQAIPFTLLLFFLFPRLHGPLWAFHSSEKVAKTGLSDTVSPGSISRLIQSKEIAFRAEFFGQPPSPGQRYWRGPVMWRTDGRNWTRSREMMSANQQQVNAIESHDYRVFLEATRQHWLFLLDLPGKVSERARITRDFQVISHKPVTRTKSYTATSFVAYEPLVLGRNQRQLALQTPGRVSKRVEELAQSWQASSKDDREIVNKALGYFRDNPFVYTLRPPLLGNDPADEFLFETRRGFCEHYATSFTLLMRLAGIPSRLVTGYLGGEFNPRGNYLIVRQSDAHAWSEVWIEGRGWIRVDPTAAISPERVDQQLNIESTEGDALYVVRSNGMFDQLFQNIHWGIDALNMSWYRWVIGYDRSKQRNLLAGLGIDRLGYHRLMLIAVFVLAALLGLYYLAIYYKDRRVQEPVQQVFLHFLKRLEKIGIVKDPWEGPLDFMHKVKSSRPDLSNQIEPILRDYLDIRYGSVIGKDEAFILSCKRFRPTKNIS